MAIIVSWTDTPIKDDHLTEELWARLKTNIQTGFTSAVHATTDVSALATANKIMKRDASGDALARVLKSNVETGTPPLNVISTTLVPLLYVARAALADTVTMATATNIAGGAAGSLPYQSAADVTAFLAKGTEGQFCRQGASSPEWSAIPYILIREEQLSGTNGGTFAAGSYVTRVLNTEVIDTYNLASIAANRITLAAGTYKCLIICPGFRCGVHKARLYNITTSAVTLLGNNAHTSWEPSSDDYSSITYSIVIGVFTIAVSTVFEVQHRCGVTQATNGRGITASFGDVEVYTVAEFWRIG